MCKKRQDKRWGDMVYCVKKVGVSMYNGMEKINGVLEYIECHITEELRCEEMAQIMQLSVYEFRRIFSFVVGCPLAEYIRNRRLTLAACEIMADGREDLSALAQKYGYSSQSAFCKAFKEMHGVSPTACRKEGGTAKLFSKPHLEIAFHGNETVPFRLVNLPAFSVYGYRGLSALTDTCCCESVWNGFYDSQADARLAAAGGDEIYACYDNDGADGNVICTIGCPLSDSPGEDMATVSIPAARWACFTLNTTEDDAVNRLYNKIYFDWLPSANLRKAALPVVEVYPFAMEEDGFSWEIRIPVISL